jgi:hypothetical protein
MSINLQRIPVTVYCYDALEAQKNTVAMQTSKFPAVYCFVQPLEEQQVFIFPALLVQQGMSTLLERLRATD